MVFFDQIFLAGGTPLAPFADFGKKLLRDFVIPSPPHVRTKSDLTASLIYLKNMLTVIPFSSQLPPSHHHLQCSG